MPNLRSPVLALSLSLALAFGPVAQGYSRSLTGPEVFETEAVDLDRMAVNGRLPIRVNREFNLPFLQLEGEVGNRQLILVAINNKAIKDMSEQELDKILVGKTDTKAVIDLVSIDGDATQITLAYQLSKDSQAVGADSSALTLLEPFSPLDGNRGPFGAYIKRPGNLPYESQNLDVLAIAADRGSLELVSNWPGPLQFLTNCTALTSLCSALSLGNFDAAEKFWKSVEKTLDFKDGRADVIAEIYPPAILQLLQAGRNQQAVTLARRLLVNFEHPQNESFESFHYSEPANRRPVLKACAQALATSDKVAAEAVADQLAELNFDSVWLGDFYSLLGVSLKAKQCFLQAANPDSASGESSFYLRRLQTYALYRLAQLQQESSERQNTLDQCRKIYTANLTQTQLANLEKVALGPTLEQINSKELPAVAPFSKIVTGAARQHNLLNQAYNRISAGTPPEVEVASLLEMDNVTSFNFPSALLQLARKLSDRQMYSLSDQLLVALSAPRFSRAFFPISVEAEKAINFEREKNDQSVSDLWLKLESDLTGLSLYKSDRIRLWGLSYAYCGDLKRAALFFKHAQVHSLAEFQQSENLNGRVFFLLDQADNLYSSGQYELGDQSFAEALSTIPKFEAVALLPDAKKPYWTPNYAQQVLESFYGSIATKIVCASSHAKNLKQSELMLQQALNSVPALKPAADHRAPGPAVRVALAKLKYAQGNYAEAKDLIAGAETTWTNADGDLLVFKADCELALRNWPAAVEDYINVSNSGYSVNPPLGQSGYAEFYYRKALEAALQWSTIGNEKLAEIYILIADETLKAPYRPDEGLALLKKALVLLPNESSKKSTVAAKISQLELNLAYAKQQSESRAGKTAVLEKNPDVIKHLRNVADLAEQNQQDNRVQALFQLATAEAEAGLVDQAIIHDQHATDLMFKPKYESLRTLEQGGAAITIALKGKVKESEKILLAQSEKVKGFYGYPSLEFEIQQGILFRFYCHTMQLEKALLLVEQVLTVNSNKLEFGQNPCDSGRYEILNFAKYMASDKHELTFAGKVYEKFLKAYSQYFSSDDLRIAQILELQAALLPPKSPAAMALIHQASSIKEMYTLSNDTLTSNDLTGRVKDLENLYASLSKAPYSDTAGSTLFKLIPALDQANDPQLEKYVLLALKFIDHGPGMNSYPYNGESALGMRCRIYTTIIENKLKTKQPGQAKEWLARAVAAISIQPSVQELLFLGKNYLLCGDKFTASDYYNRAVRANNLNPGQNFPQNDLTDLGNALK